MTRTASGPTSRPRFLAGARTSKGIRRIRRGWLTTPLPTMEEVEERMRNYRGFFARLTPGQLAALKAYDGPDVLGSPNGPKRDF